MPKLLLLDEPLAALDRKLREETQFELTDIQERVGMTFLVVTHDQEEALRMATRVAVMNAGEIVQIGAPAEIYERPNSRFVADFVGTVNMFEGRVVEDEPDHITLAVPDLDVGDEEGAIHVGHGVSCTLDQTLWYAVRPEKLRLTRERPPERNAFPVHVDDVAYMGDLSVYRLRLKSGRLLHATKANLRAVRRRRHHLARGRLGLLARHRRRGAVKR